MLKRRYEKDNTKKLFFIVLGNLLCAVAFNVFFIPSQLLRGGVGGIALMLGYLLNVPTGITVFLINIPIFILGAKMVNREL
ncbi:MAG: YitT family protein [Bacillota bacterium]